jgi:hypothetical protein
MQNSQHSAAASIAARRSETNRGPLPPRRNWASKSPLAPKEGHEFQKTVPDTFFACKKRFLTPFLPVSLIRLRELHETVVSILWMIVRIPNEVALIASATHFQPS